MTFWKTASLVAFLAGACTNVVDTDGITPIDDYESWHRIDVTGAVSGHGDTYRIIYVNDAARGWIGAGEYPLGSAIVKEIRGITGDEMPGSLKYLSVARKLEEAPEGGALDKGWLFTYVKKAGADEDNRDMCYRKCHAAAPYDSMFLDYGLH